MDVFLIGMAIGAIIGLVVVLALTFHGPSTLTVDRWWLENAERWEWLREYELEQG